MNGSKNNILFVFSGGIIAICVILLFIMIGNKNLLKKHDAYNKTTNSKILNKDIKSNSKKDNKNNAKNTKAKNDTNDTIKPEDTALEQKVQDIIHHLKLNQKIAQLFIVSPDVLTGVNNVTVAGETTKNTIKNYTVGGLVYDSGNLIEPLQVKNLLSKTDEYSMNAINLPMFLAIKNYGENLSLLKNNPNFNVDNQNIPQDLSTMEVSYSEALGQYVGKYLKDLGFNMNFSPSGLLGDKARSFGSSSATTSEKCAKFYMAQKKEDIIGIYTDFPGYDGDFEILSNGILSSNLDKNSLFAKNLIPYTSAMQYGVDAIMLNNLAYPDITSSVAPAFMSYKMLNDFIKDELKYDGLIITPPLNTEDLTSAFSSDELTLSALNAGCDMICEPENFYLSYETIMEAVKDGRISEDRIDKSLSKIIKLKLMIKQNFN